MFAIFKSGGKQYKAKAGDVFKLEKLEGEAGATIQLTDILMFGGEKTDIGADASKGKLTAEILEQTKGEKILVFKKKRRHNYRRKNGHRQLLTVVRITEMTNPAGKTEKAEVRPFKAPRTEAEITASAQKAFNARAAKSGSTRTSSLSSPAKAPKAKVAAEPKAAAKKPAVKAAAATTTEKKPAAKKAVAKKKED
jgi:large subunit ribosomal protein L21